MFHTVIPSKSIFNRGIIPSVIILILTLSTTQAQVRPSVIRIIYGKYTDPRDGTQYKTIELENNTWLAENLRYEIPGKSFVYPGDPIHEEVYGRLYTWEAAIEACPEGWHLPTDSEWFGLEFRLGVADSLLETRGWRKCIGVASLKSDSGWLAATHSNDSLGFSALPGGFRDQDGYFFNEGYFAYFWTATTADHSDAWYRVVTNDIPHVGRFSYSKAYAFSIRCIKPN